MLVTSFVLALSVSIDAFGIGITYGLKSTNVSRISKIILFIISVSFTLISTFIGTNLTYILPNSSIKIIGSTILIGIGLWSLYQAMNSPISFDFDKSNDIDWKESIFLGTALSIDSIGVGISSSFVGINPIVFSIFVATFQLIFLFIGKFASLKIISISKLPENTWAKASGILLIIIGILKFWV